MPPLPDRCRAPLAASACTDFLLTPATITRYLASETVASMLAEIRV